MEKILSKSALSKGKYIESSNIFSFSSGQGLMTKPKLCEKCGKEADKLCVNCSTPYCSLFCRNSDGQHELFCQISKTTLGTRIHEIDQNDNVTSTEITEIPSIAMKSNCNVRITCIVDQRNVFVRPSDEINNMKFIRLLNDVAKYATTAKNLKNQKIGMIALAPFENVYNRVLLLKKENNDHMIVAFIDFGNVGRVKTSEIKEISNKLRLEPRSAVKILLKDVPEILYNEASMKWLNKVWKIDLNLKFNDKHFVSGQTECDLSAIELLNSLNKRENERSYIREKRKMFHFSDISDDDLQPDQLYLKYFTHDKRIDGKNIKAIILDNSMLEMSLVSFIEYNDMQMFLRNHRKIQHFGNYLYNDEDGPYTPG